MAIMARPRADDWLDVDIAAWKAGGLEVIVSLLEPEEISDLGLQREGALCRASGIEFLSFPVPDRGVLVMMTGSGAGLMRKRIAAPQ